MGPAKAHCFGTKNTLLVQGMKLDYKWLKDYESKYTSLYVGFSYHIETALLQFLHKKSPLISGIHVTKLSKSNSQDSSRITIEFHVYYSLYRKIDIDIFTTWLIDGISAEQLKSIHADKSSNIKG